MFTHIPVFLRENFIYGCSFVRFVQVYFCGLEKKHCRKEEIFPQNMFKSRTEKNTEERNVKSSSLLPEVEGVSDGVTNVHTCSQ